VNAALEFEGVTIRYPGTGAAVITDASLRIDQGEKVALFGCNGSGKTTLLLAAAGIIPFTGRIVIDGVPVEKKTLSRVHERMGFLFNIPEDQILFPRVIDDVAWGLVRKGVPQVAAHVKAKATLDALGIAALAESTTYQLSHGQRQRVALAGALVCGPSVLLLDEPSSALDPRGKMVLARTLRSLDSAMLVVTHDVEFAESICSAFTIIESGELHNCPNTSCAKASLLQPDPEPA